MTDRRVTAVDAVERIGWGWLLAYGVASVVLGVVAFLWPVAATYAATIVLGCYLLAISVAALVAGWRGHGLESRGYALGLAALSLIVGLLILIAPVAGAVSLTVLVAVWLLVRGVMEVGLGARFRRHRGAMIALGAVNILLALYVFATLPWSAMTLPGFILGISFLAGGVVAIGQALAHRPATPARL